MVIKLLLLRGELRAHRGESSIGPELQGLRPQPPWPLRKGKEEKVKFQFKP